MQVIIATPQELKNYMSEVLREFLLRENPQKTGSTPVKKYLSFEEAATYLGVAHSTLYTYNSSRLIPYFNRGRKNYYLQSDLDNFINDHRKQTKNEAITEADAKIRKRKA